MIKSFKDLQESQEYLEEKLLMLNNGKKYGQVVFLAGGAGSGKGFSSGTFMQRELFKVFDVDELKKAFMKLADMKNKYPEIQGLDLKNPKDTAKMHMFIKDKDVNQKVLDTLLSASGKTKPNLMFDITAKDIKNIQFYIPKLMNAGYNPANIHMVWVLTNYELAIRQNIERAQEPGGRMVPSDIMLVTHKGAAQTVYDYIEGRSKKLPINGEIHVILNNREHTVFFEPTGADRRSKVTGKINLGNVKDFKYMTIKKRGKPILDEKTWQKQLYSWIAQNIPQADLRDMVRQKFSKEIKKTANKRMAYRYGRTRR